MPTDPKHHHDGHRDRLRDRFLKSGADSLQDYELLELILFQTHPRMDVKPLAKDLIAHFGSFANVINASSDDLMNFPKIGKIAATAFKTIQAASLKLTAEQIFNKPIFASWQHVLSHYRAMLAHEKIEQFRLLFLDSKNQLIKDELQNKGTINETAIYPREVVKRALELGASAIIMVHNHPTGDPAASKSDIEMTLQIKKALDTVGIHLHDHLIIAAKGHTSLKNLGII